MKPFIADNFEGISAVNDGYLYFRINRNTLAAVIISILAHVLLLSWLAVKKIEFDQSSAAKTPSPLQISLAPHPAPAPEKTESLPLSEAEQPAPSKPLTSKPLKSKPRPSKPQSTKKTRPAPDIMALNKSAPDSFEQPAQPKTAPLPEAAPSQPPAMDMMSYINAQRAKRQQSETDAVRENAAAASRERVPSQDEMRDAVIKRNLQSGQNGIFQIVNMSAHSAQFVFRGWTTDYSNSRRELIQVEAPPDVDIQRAVVRRMIELIRRYHHEDFNWESQRLGRVVILSARLRDNAGLEDFLINEFFGSAGRSFN